MDARKQSYRFYVNFGLITLILLGSCSSGVENSNSGPPPIQVVVTPEQAVVPATETQQFSARVANSTNSSVTWKVDDIEGGNASVGQISTDGLYTAPSTAGRHTITATSVEDSTKSDTASVEVRLVVTVGITPANVSLSTSQTQQFTATVQNATNTEVRWAVDSIEGGNENVGTISPTGLYRAPANPGTHVITATSVEAPTRSASAQVTVKLFTGVLTSRNDNGRTGQNLKETILTPRNVNTATFGKLFTLYVDGFVYAQPLYASNVSIGGQLRNVLYVATEHNSVYAFDADNLAAGPLWHVSFIDPANGITTVPYQDTGSPPGYTGPGPVMPGGCGDLVPEIGITGTPVIDPATNTLYVVAKTKEVSGSTVAYEHRLHALDIATGAARPGSGQALRASVPGTTTPNDGNGRVIFQSLRQNQRPALLLKDNVITIAFSSHCVIRPYQGWVLSYDAQSLNQISAFNVSPNDPKGKGGIWHSGSGPAADDSGNIYVTSGDGPFDAASGGTSYSNSVLKLTNGSLGLVDYFTPFNQQQLENSNADLSAGGPVLLPEQGGTPLMISIGKQGIAYLLNRNNLGRFQAGSDSQIVQSFGWGQCGVGNCLIYGTPAYFDNKVYMAAVDDRLRSYTLSDGRFLPTSVQSPNTFPWPGASPVISANGSSDAIVWTLQTNGSGQPAALHAYSAADVSTRLYSSDENAGRDSPGPAVKFTIPTVANGRVYVGSQYQVSVFGLLP